MSFRKLQIVISQTADSHFANYRFSFRKLQIFISFRFAPFRFANYSEPVKTNKMADLPFPQIRAKKFRQQEIDLDQFTDEELFSKNGFGRESIQYLVEILKNDLERQTRRKPEQLPTWLLLHVVNCGHYKTGTADCGLRTADCGLDIRYKDYVIKTGPIISS